MMHLMLQANAAGHMGETLFVLVSDPKHNSEEWLSQRGVRASYDPAGIDTRRCGILSRDYQATI